MAEVPAYRPNGNRYWPYGPPYGAPPYGYGAHGTGYGAHGTGYRPEWSRYRPEWSRYPAGGSRYAPAAPGYGHMRASDADRERAVDVLKAGFAEGRLTQEEFAERQAGALKARTYQDLAALTADLPAGPLGVPAAGPAPLVAYPPFPVARRMNRLAVASVLAAFIPVFGCVVAIALGHTALSEIRDTGEGGSGFAALGLGLGYFTLGLFVLVALLLSAH